TNSYITSGCAGSSCVAGSVSTATEQNYDNVLFSGALNVSTSPKPYSTYSTSTANAGTIVDSTNSVTFSMINDGASEGGSNNVWILGQTGNPTITVPVGVYGVSDVYTMLNTELASAAFANRDVTLFFNFGTTSNASTVQTVTVKLVNSNNSTTAGGQVRNAVDCAPPSTSCGGVSTAASGSLLTSTVISGVTVKTNNVYTSPFTSATGSYVSNTSGTLNLDDQGFFFNGISLSTLGTGATNLNTYLVSIGVREAGTSPDIASLGLSAITIDTVSAPEPSTILMLLTGLGALAFARGRRIKA
ncbi:MAG: PEP-CTERM sorting domain-containing protein, partial [Acidobacteriota bacterium]|nr:PEP-CTERM sorting domain-containing protein [Acidobacteriota bacterium]